MVIEETAHNRRGLVPNSKFALHGPPLLNDEPLPGMHDVWLDSHSKFVDHIINVTARLPSEKVPSARVKRFSIRLRKRGNGYHQSDKRKERDAGSPRREEATLECSDIQ